MEEPHQLQPLPDHLPDDMTGQLAACIDALKNSPPPKEIIEQQRRDLEDKEKELKKERGERKKELEQERGERKKEREELQEKETELEKERGERKKEREEKEKERQERERLENLLRQKGIDPNEP